MTGGVSGSGLASRISPRLVGRRLHTDGVMASKRCNGSPNRSRDSGCTCHSMLADACSASLFANAPSWDGGHGEWSGSEQGVLGSHQGLAEPRPRSAVQGTRAGDLVDRPDLQVVVQVGPHSRQRVYDVDAVGGQV